MAKVDIQRGAKTAGNKQGDTNKDCANAVSCLENSSKFEGRAWQI
jgi:hypothetical protein